MDEKKTILVVDDAVTNLKYIETALSDTYKTVLAKSGEQCFKYLRNNLPDLILLDVNMPEMDGYEVLSILKSDTKLERIPVIFLTADDDEKSEARGLSLGAMDYIKKPFVLEIMKFRIDRIIELYELKNNLQRQVDKKTTQIQKMSLDVIITIAKALEAKDTYTRNHSIRVAEYSMLIGECMGVKGQELTNLYYAAMMHDIGKIGVPDSVLKKRGALTDEEYSVIKSHPVIGKQILSEMPSIKELAVGPYCHHERYDGSGYPNGLKGEGIPYIARVIAVADSYDAMTSDRCYRKKRSREYVMHEFIEGRGKQFDPQILDIFIELLESGNEIVNKCFTE